MQNFDFNSEFRKLGEENTQPQQQQMSFDNNGEIVMPKIPKPKLKTAPQPMAQPMPQQPMQQGGQPNTRMEVSSVKQQIADAMQNKTISDSVLASLDKLITQNQLVFPKNYNVGNEVKMAYYSIMSVTGVNTCNPMSIANALCETAIQGLSTSKKQCYYIKYGDSISMQRSYFGDIALAKRTGLIKDIFANVIRQGDEFEMAYDDMGREVVVVHKTKFENQDNEIIGAYACAINLDDTKRYCIMTKKMLDANFSLSKARNNNGEVKFQRDFPGEASKRTAIRRLVKMIFNTDINDDDLTQEIINSYNRTEDEYQSQDTKYNNTVIMNAEVKEYSNVEEVSDDF